MRIRMYRQGFGDCLLLTFPGEGRDFTLLVDCGALPGTPSGKIRDVAEDVRGSCHGVLDAIVATHEHWDHLSGFCDAQDIFDQMAVAEVWFAWTENPSDRQAERMRRELDSRIRSLHASAERWTAAGVRPGAAAAAQELLGFFGRTAVSGGPRTREALTYLGGKSQGERRYLQPGDTFLLPTVPSARVFVLGPPRDERLLRRTGPSSPHRGVSGKAGALHAENYFFAALGGEHGMPLPDVPTDPFEPHFRIPLREAGSHPFFQKHYGFDPGGSDDAKEWRRIDNDWLASTGQLALALDAYTNNTSLVLAIELSEGGKVVLLAGDAQLGNWLSWREVTFTIQGADTPRVVKAADLLARTVLYKVSHHGSHNGTFITDEWDNLDHPDLVAMIPVDGDVAAKRRWNIPFAPLLTTLDDRARGRVLRSDLGTPDSRNKAFQALGRRDRERFLAAVTETPLFIDYVV